MGFECARHRKSEETEKGMLTKSVGTQVDEVTGHATPPSIFFKLTRIRHLTEPISTFYQILPRASGTSSLVQAQLLSTGQPCTLRILSKEKVVTEKVSKGLVADLLVHISSLDHPHPPSL